MRQSKIRMLIKLVEESDIGELEVSSWGQRVRIRKKVHPENNSHNPGNPPPVASTASQRAGLEIAAQEAVTQVSKTELVEIKSPMVGTFYRSPAPDAKPYVEIGQVVRPDDVVCLIEAMKIMNEVKAEISGRVVEVLVENAKPVQFGQPLFLVEPA